jgi:hypothetical protein
MQKRGPRPRLKILKTANVSYVLTPIGFASFWRKAVL